LRIRNESFAISPLETFHPATVFEFRVLPVLRLGLDTPKKVLVGTVKSFLEVNRVETLPSGGFILLQLLLVVVVSLLW